MTDSHTLIERARAMCPPSSTMSANMEYAHPGTQDYIKSANTILKELADELERVTQENERLTACIVAHHNIAHLSDKAVRDYFGAPSGCGICRAAVPHAQEPRGVSKRSPGSQVPLQHRPAQEPRG